MADELNAAQAVDAGGEALEAAEGSAAAEQPEGNSLLTEGVSEGGEGEGVEQAQAQDAGAADVPERYELAMPKGWTLDEEGLAELTPIMRELGATNKQVQAVADVYVRRASAARERQIAAERETVKGWREELKNDPEVGGEKFNENLAGVKKMLIKFGNEEFYNYLDDSGLGNYPPFVRVMVRLSKELADDSFVQGSGAYADEPAAAAAKMIFDRSLKD